MYPECEEIMRLAPDYHIIPVCKEIYADVITPVSYTHLRAHET